MEASLYRAGLVKISPQTDGDAFEQFNRVLRSPACLTSEICSDLVRGMYDYQRFGRGDRRDVDESMKKAFDQQKCSLAMSIGRSRLRRATDVMIFVGTV